MSPRSERFVKYLTLFLLIGLAIAFVMSLVSIAIGQESDDTPAEDPPPALSVTPLPPPSEIKPPADSSKWCDIFVSNASPKDVLVVDNNSHYMPRVRQVFLWFRVGLNQPVARLYSWDGLYRPTKVTSEIWAVRQLRVVDPTEFQKIVDAINAAEATAAAAPKRTAAATTPRRPDDE